MVKYEEFKIFHEKHPDLDNSEYYAEFPDTNKSTIRSWKNKVKQPKAPYGLPQDPVEPSKPIEKETADYSKLQDYLITTLMTQTGVKEPEIEGLDNNNKIIVLQNKAKALAEKQGKGRAPNSSILPAPKPDSITTKKFGIDDYIIFDEVKNEIRMEIPWDVLADPEKNKGLGLRK